MRKGEEGTQKERREEGKLRRDRKEVVREAKREVETEWKAMTLERRDRCLISVSPNLAWGYSISGVQPLIQQYV